MNHPAGLNIAIPCRRSLNRASSCLFREFLFPPPSFSKRRRRPLVAWNTVTLKKGGREKKKIHWWYVRFPLIYDWEDKNILAAQATMSRFASFFYFLIKTISNPILTPKNCLHIRVFRYKGSNKNTEIFSCVLCNILRQSISSCLEKNIFFKKNIFLWIIFLSNSLVCVRARVASCPYIPSPPPPPPPPLGSVWAHREEKRRERERDRLLLLFPPPPPPPLSSLRRLCEKAKGKLSQGVTAGGGVERFWKKRK